jgi:hypothetical protein
MKIPNPSPTHDIHVANSADEIPTLTERHCFQNNPSHYRYHLDFDVIIDNVVYSVLQAAANKELTEEYWKLTYKSARFLRSTNEYKQYSTNREVIQDQEMIDTLMSTWPRHYCVRNEYGLECIDKINEGIRD